jgi:hypothetical protein
MKRFEFLLFAFLIPIVGFVAVQAANTPRITAVTQAAALDTMTRSAITRSATGTVGRKVKKAKRLPNETVIDSDLDLDPVRDVEDIRRRLLEGERGTYIPEILLQRDSALARWPERLYDPLRIWIANGNGLKDWDSTFVHRVRDAFNEWSAIGIPVRFTFAVDSADADIHVSWTPQFNEPISGKTLWARDRSWWIVSGHITLALHHNEGEPLDGSSVKAIALHEVGHLLGLDHTSDTSNIMTPKVRARGLSEGDRATVRLLYSLPPGSVK